MWMRVFERMRKCSQPRAEPLPNEKRPTSRRRRRISPSAPRGSRVRNLNCARPSISGAARSAQRESFSSRRRRRRSPFHFRGKSERMCTKFTEKRANICRDMWSVQEGQSETIFGIISSICRIPLSAMSLWCGSSPLFRAKKVRKRR